MLERSLLDPPAPSLLAPTAATHPVRPSPAEPGAVMEVHLLQRAAAAVGDDRAADGVYRAIFHGLPVACVVTDAAGITVQTNALVGPLLGADAPRVGTRFPPRGEGVIDAGGEARECVLPGLLGRVRASAARVLTGAGELSVWVLVRIAGDLPGHVVAPDPAAPSPGRADPSPGFRPTVHPLPVAGPPSALVAESEPVSAQSLLAPSDPTAPLTERLRAGIAAGLHLGLIQPGTRLPSVRALAAAAAADHRAVGAAYRALGSDGVVVVRGRQGAFVAERPRAVQPELGETGEWVARLLTQAAALRVRVAQLPGLLRRYTAATTVRCACMESVEDELVTLSEEFRGQWGLDAYPVVAGEGLAASIDQARGAQLIVTTAFHAAEAEEVARALGIPLAVVRAAPAFTQAVLGALSRGPLSVVAADARYLERLRFLPGSERLRGHLVGDPDALDAVDSDAGVLVTAAARRRIGERRMRMLLAPSEFVSQECGPLVAAVLVSRNGAAPAPEPVQ